MPRPIRRVLLGSAAVSCLIASALAVTQLIEVSSGVSGGSALLYQIVAAVCLKAFYTQSSWSPVECDCCQDASVGMSGASGDTVKTLLIDLAGFAAFGALFQWEAGAAERRIEERSQVWFCLQKACY